MTRDFWRQQENLPRSPGARSPANDISFLGTRAAMTAIIDHLGRNTAPRSSDDDTYSFRTGFVGFPDRDWLIGEMKRASERPDYAVTQGFFDLLSELQTLKNLPRPAGADATFVGSKKDAQGQYIKDAQGRYIPAAPTPAQQLQIRRAAAPPRRRTGGRKEERLAANRNGLADENRGCARYDDSFAARIGVAD